jgi:hypothetical protein
MSFGSFTLLTIPIPFPVFPLTSRSTASASGRRRRSRYRLAILVFPRLPLLLLLGVLASSGDALIVTAHAPDPLIRLGEDELLNLV